MVETRCSPSSSSDQGSNDFAKKKAIFWQAECCKVNQPVAKLLAGERIIQHLKGKSRKQTKRTITDIG